MLKQKGSKVNVSKLLYNRSCVLKVCKRFKTLITDLLFFKTVLFPIQLTKVGSCFRAGSNDLKRGENRMGKKPGKQIFEDYSVYPNLSGKLKCMAKELAQRTSCVLCGLCLGVFVRI